MPGMTREENIAWYKERIEHQKQRTIELEGGIMIDRNMVVWKSLGKLWIKVTDYQKGYWAQTPLDENAAVRLQEAVFDALMGPGILRDWENNLKKLEAQRAGDAVPKEAKKP